MDKRRGSLDKKSITEVGSGVPRQPRRARGTVTFFLPSLGELAMK